MELRSKCSRGGCSSRQLGRRRDSEADGGGQPWQKLWCGGKSAGGSGSDDNGVSTCPSGVEDSWLSYSKDTRFVASTPYRWSSLLAPSEVHGQIWVSSLEFMVRVTFNLRSLGGKSFPRILLHLSRAKTQTFKQPSSIPQDTRCLSDFPTSGRLPSSSPLYTTAVSTAHPHQQ